MAKSYHQQVIQYLNDNYRCNLGMNDIEVGSKHPYVKFNYNGKTIRLTLNREETNRGLAFKLKQQDIRRVLGEPPTIIDSFTKLEDERKKEVMQTAMKTIDSLGHMPEHIDEPSICISPGTENVDFNGVAVMNTEVEVEDIKQDFGKVFVAQYASGGPRFLISDKTASLFFPSGKISYKRLSKCKFEFTDNPNSFDTLKVSENTRSGFFVYYAPRDDSLAEPSYGMSEANITAKDKVLQVEVVNKKGLSNRGIRRNYHGRRNTYSPEEVITSGSKELPSILSSASCVPLVSGIEDYTNKMKSILEDLKFIESNSPFRLVKTRTNEGEVWDWRVRF